MGREPALVVVDVQPEYCAGWSQLPLLMEHINAHQGPVIFLVNAEQTGLSQDTFAGCERFWLEHGLNEGVLDEAEVVDKGFAYLRPWMDMGIDEATIQRVIHHMAEIGVHDSRDMDPAELEELVGDEFSEDMLFDPISTNWLDPALMRRMAGGLLCGGHEIACLREVELMLRGQEVPHTVLAEFVYADMAPAPGMRP